VRVTRGHRRSAALAVLVAATAATVALAGPMVDTGSISVTGTGVGSVAVTGRVVVLGSVATSRAQLEIITLRSSATLGVAGRTRRIPIGRDVTVTAGMGAFFGVTANSGQIRVIVRGRGIATTIAGAGTVIFSGRGTYSFGYPPLTRLWPKTALTLRQPTGQALKHAPRPHTDAHATTVP
jgi:hypothetical protein